MQRMQHALRILASCRGRVARNGAAQLPKLQMKFADSAANGVKGRSRLLGQIVNLYGRHEFEKARWAEPFRPAD